MAYETQHILDFVMEDDTRREGTDVSVEVDTNETVKISFGNSFTLRTSYNSLNDLIMALERASDELDNPRRISVGRSSTIWLDLEWAGLAASLPAAVWETLPFA